MANAGLSVWMQPNPSATFCASLVNSSREHYYNIATESRIVCNHYQTRKPSPLGDFSANPISDQRFHAVIALLIQDSARSVSAMN